MIAPTEGIPMVEWGEDHWSIFAYIETRCVDYQGKPNPLHIQTNRYRHPAMGNTHDGSAYSIRLKNRELPGPDYDEWDCLDDCEREGLLENIGTGINRAYKLTDKGLKIAAELRAFKANGGTFARFVPAECQ